MSKVSTSLEQLRDRPDDELRQHLAETRDELFRLKLGQHTNQVTSTAAVMQKRREIARVLTILRSRAHGSEAQGQKPKKAKS
jgi:ribosomal protein L29